MRKLESVRPELPQASLLHGDPNGARSAIIGYGANRGPIVEAQDRLAEAGVADALSCSCARCGRSPKTKCAISLKDADHIFVVENNYTGQLERLIRYVVGPLPNMRARSQVQRRPFRPIEIIERDSVERCGRAAGLCGGLKRWRR